MTWPDAGGGGLRRKPRPRLADAGGASFALGPLLAKGLAFFLMRNDMVGWPVSILTLLSHVRQQSDGSNHTNHQQAASRSVIVRCGARILVRARVHLKEPGK